MSTTAFANASSITRNDDGTYRWAIPDGWQQGRGAFGGLVLGTLARAMDDVARVDARALRSFTGDLCAPALPGDATITVTTLRRGKGLTFLNALLEQSGTIVARASAAFAATRPVHTPKIATHAPKSPPSGDVAPAVLAGAAVFAKHYEYRPTGPTPFSSSPDAVCSGFVREIDALDLPLDAPAIIALLDAWWPASFSIDDAFHPIATITFTAEILVDPSTIRANEPLQYFARDVAAREGFFVEMRELWSKGSLVALNQQTFAVIG